MRILWVKAGKLFPVNGGGRIRTINILRYLALRNEVTVFSYYQGPRDPLCEGELNRHFPNSISIPISAPGNGSPRLQRTLHYLSKVLSPAPYAVSQFNSRTVRHSLREQLQNGRYDVAVCDFMAATLNFPTDLTTATVLFQHNVEAALWKRQSKTAANLMARLAFTLEAAKMSRYEPRTIKKFDHVIAVSEYDRRLMSGLPDERITVVPTGVDLTTFTGKKRSAGDDPIVVFTGAMDWEANVDGIEYFCREIWPKILCEIPRATLQIVGREPGTRINNLKSSSIEVTGTVPSILAYLERAATVIVPLRIGGGTRLKIYEAMAMGKAIVSTSIGAEGLDVHPGRDIMLADTPGEFAGSVIRFLKDEPLRWQYGDEAAKTAAQYDWSVIARKFEDVLVKTAADNRAKVAMTS
jgi:polysaccharide biosynthesis protein PslH